MAILVQLLLFRYFVNFTFTISILESLPNVKGNAGVFGGTVKPNGPFRVSGQIPRTAFAGSNASYVAYTDFDESRVLDIFQDNAPVRPNSLSLIFVIKY